MRTTTASGISHTIAAFAGALVAASTTPTFADASGLDVSIIEVANAEQLTEKFCAASPNDEHIILLPASMFVDSQELVCESGSYKLYRIVEHDDPDDFEYFLDPPFGTTNRLGCDGKAGRRMEIVAVNCRPE